MASPSASPRPLGSGPHAGRSYFFPANSLQQIPCSSSPPCLHNSKFLIPCSKLTPKMQLHAQFRAAREFCGAEAARRRLRPLFRRLWHPRAAQTALVRAPERISCKFGGSQSVHSRFTAGRPRGSQLARSRGSGPCKVTWLCRRSGSLSPVPFGKHGSQRTRRGTRFGRRGVARPNKTQNTNAPLFVLFGGVVGCVVAS